MCCTMQVVVNMLSSPLTGNPASWIAFSFNPEAVRDARKRGLPVLFGDGSNINVMRAATGAPSMHHNLSNYRSGSKYWVFVSEL